MKKSSNNNLPQQPENNDQLQHVQLQIEEVKSVMRSNIDRALERHEQIEDLLEPSEILRDEADRFRRGANKLKCELLKRNVKSMVAGFIIIVLLIIIFVYIGKQNK